jgi:Holliday junction resolvase RusA-like endonuclease
MHIDLLVEGNPVPQGSFRHVGNGRIISANPKLNAWRDTIATQIAQQTHHRLIEAPIRLQLVFTLPRPKSVSKTLRPLPSARVGDVDKLARAVMDAISLERYCQIIKDDSLVTDLHAAKRYADHTKPGVSIMITW